MEDSLVENFNIVGVSILINAPHTYMICDKIKLNIDGSFQPEGKCGGWGFIARDGQGVVCGAGAGFLLHMLAARFNQKLMHVGKL